MPKAFGSRNYSKLPIRMMSIWREKFTSLRPISCCKELKRCNSFGRCHVSKAKVHLGLVEGRLPPNFTAWNNEGHDINQPGFQLFHVYSWCLFHCLLWCECQSGVGISGLTKLIWAAVFVYIFLANDGDHDDMRFRNKKPRLLYFASCLNIALLFGSCLFCFFWLGGKMSNKSLIKTPNRPFQDPQWKSRLWMLSRQVAKGPLSCAMTWNNLACFYRWGNFVVEFGGDFFSNWFLKG